jgi:copper chaperone
MFETKLKVDGMMCGMCESHINDAVRSAVNVKKVSSSHTKGETVIITEQEPDTAAIKAAIDATGYEVNSINVQPYEKKGLFGFMKK